MNVQPPIVVEAENVSALVLDVPKNAVRIGTVSVFQFVAALKLPDVGLGSESSCALPMPGANAVTATSAVVASSAPHHQHQPPPDNLDRGPSGSPAQEAVQAASRSSRCLARL